MNEFRIQERLMGSAFELIILHTDADEAQRLLQAGVNEIKRIEHLLSEFRPDSEISIINRNAGKTAVKVCHEVFSLIERCLSISNATKGSFDINMGALKKIYKFNNTDFEFPSKAVVKSTLQNVGSDKIKLNKQKKEVLLDTEDMALSFAAIGKGYAADCVRMMWLAEGVQSGVISASGDLTTIGYNREGKPWTIGIANPDKAEEMLFYIPVENAAVATSGDYMQYFMHNGIRYSHNINPLNGMPVTGVKSVSVFSKAAELADALATAVYVMGPETGLHFIELLPDTHCIIIDANNNIHCSKNILLN